MRITYRTTIDRALADLGRGQERVADLQQRLATGKRINKPSDDPAGITRALSIRTDLKLTTQYMRNIDSGIARVNATEAGLATVTELLQRARELAILGGNETNDQDQRNNIAAEVSGLLDEAIAVSNSRFAGQYIFGGHLSTVAPFSPVGVPTTSVTYNGDSGVVERDISVGVRVQINVAGDTALGTTFTALIALRDDLLSGDTGAVRTADLQALDTALDDVLSVRGQLGSTANRLDLTRQRLDLSSLASQEQLSALEDADIVETIVDLNAQEAVYQAALATVARSIQSTLINFLR